MWDSLELTQNHNSKVPLFHCFIPSVAHHRIKQRLDDNIIKHLANCECEVLSSLHSNVLPLLRQCLVSSLLQEYRLPTESWSARSLWSHQTSVSLRVTAKSPISPWLHRTLCLMIDSFPSQPVGFVRSLNAENGFCEAPVLCSLKGLNTRSS